MKLPILSAVVLLLASIRADIPPNSHAYLDKTERFRNSRSVEPEGNINSRPTTPKFLNSKTKPFYVNGTSIPDVDFDAGESYAGQLPIGNGGDRKLFFWFWPTLSDNNTDITIWLNGGPGCSSLWGLLEENGPILWRPGTYKPINNPFSWHRVTNMVYIDQPVGTGFATGEVDIANEDGLALEFNMFWKNFVTLFGLENRKVYITGESFAGMYAPYIGAAMLAQKDKKFFNLNGILLYDPVMGHYYQTATIVPFTRFNKALYPWDQEIQKSIDEIDEKCGLTEYSNSLMQFPPPQKDGLKYKDFPKNCSHAYNIIADEQYSLNPCLDSDYIAQQCPVPFDPVSSKYDQNYFNRDDVKKAIHAPESVKWIVCAYPVFKPNGTISQRSAIGKHSILAQVVEGTNNVIVGHATQDSSLLSNDTLANLNNMTYNGARGFTEPPTKPFLVPYPSGSGFSKDPILGYWTAARGLTFVSINLSGHMVPLYQPRAALRTLQVLLGTVVDLSSKVPVPGRPVRD